MIVETMNLWENTPGLCEETPTITAYSPEWGKKRGAVVIYAGGAYACRAPHEDRGYAEFLASNGYTAFVVSYRVAPHRFPLPLLDARRGVRFARFYAEKYGIDKDKIAVMGSSAGGNLAALTCTYLEPIAFEGIDEIDKEDFLPNAQILCYPVLRMDDEIGHSESGRNLLGDENYEMKHEDFHVAKLVSDKTPQAFIWHTFEDSAVDVRNSLEYMTALKELELFSELHVFPHGRHGLGRATDVDSVSRHIHQWNGLLLNWLEYIGF